MQSPKTVHQAPIRAMAAEVAKRKRADARATAKVAHQGDPSPQSLVVTGDGNDPLTPMDGEVVARGVSRT